MPTCCWKYWNYGKDYGWSPKVLLFIHTTFIMLLYFLPVFLPCGLKLRKRHRVRSSAWHQWFRVHSQCHPSGEEVLCSRRDSSSPQWAFATVVIIPDALWLYTFISFIWNMLETSVLWILTSTFLFTAALYFWTVDGTSCTYDNMHLSEDRGGFLTFSSFIHGNLRPTLGLRTY